MSYARICKNEYYLLWDSDTIPIKQIKLFDNERPIFDIKDEQKNINFFLFIYEIIQLKIYPNKKFSSELVIVRIECFAFERCLHVD